MNQAIELLAEYLVQKGYLRQHALLREAEEAGDRIVRTTGDNALEGVGVTFAAIRRLQLIVEDMGTTPGPYVRAEGQVEAITLNSPVDPPTWPVVLDTPGGVIPGVSPLYYAVIPPDELATLPGYAEFWPAMTSLLVSKSITALTPPPPGGELDPPPL